jgi:hypothetical protein
LISTEGASRIVVAIPARDEADKIGDCLAALGRQTKPPAAVVLLLNNCTDLTEQIARSVEVPFALDIHSVWLPPSDANAGMARRLAMEPLEVRASGSVVSGSYPTRHIASGISAFPLPRGREATP